jgi:hypothetical protein
MKTKEMFWRYPRKISLLKDLAWGYLTGGYDLALAAVLQASVRASRF